MDAQNAAALGDSPAAATAAHTGPLAGLKVIDLTSVVMGPYVTQTFADFGADVIKVESADGDTTRFMPGGVAHGMGGTFLNLNRGKRSVVLDLKSPEGRDALLRLVARADIVIHSMRSAAIARLKLRYEDIVSINPRMIYCNMYGFGRRGRYRDRAAYDDVIQAASGTSMLQSMQSGEPGYVATAIADKVTALTGIYAIMIALYHRERTGEGQELEVPMFETMVSFNLVEHIGGALFRPPVSLPYYDRVISKLRRPYRTRDGYISALVYNDKQWRAFVGLAGLPPACSEEKLDSLAKRLRNIDTVYEHVERAMAERSTDEWLETFDRVGIPAMPLMSLEDLMADEHLREVGFFEERDTARGLLKFPGIPAWFSKTPGTIREAGPSLGEHSATVLRENGFSEAEIAGLLKASARGVRAGEE